MMKSTELCVVLASARACIRRAIVRERSSEHACNSFDVAVFIAVQTLISNCRTRRNAPQSNIIRVPLCCQTTTYCAHLGVHLKLEDMSCSKADTPKRNASLEVDFCFN